MKKQKINKNLSLKYQGEERLINLANSDNTKLSNILNSPIGLNNEQRILNQQKFGINSVSIKKFNHFKKIFGVLLEPFNLLLLVISIASFLIYFLHSHEILDLISAFMILFMIFLAGTVDYIQEWKAYQSNLKLHQLVDNNFYIYNQKLTDFKSINLQNFKSNLIQIQQNNLTIGDVVYLNQGDVIPADLKIIWQNNLLINESMLTGESESVIKKTTNTAKQLLELENIAFSQTIVSKGNLIGVVVNIGQDNYSSSILKIAEDQMTESDYEKGLKRVTKILVISILSLIPIILVISGLRTGVWIHALVFSLSIAVSLTPEALPAIISSNLQVGAKKLAKQKVVIKNLGVVQNMGSVDILATDKTGTLTLDEMKLIDILDINNNQNQEISKLALINSSFQQNISNKMDQAIINKLLEKLPIDNSIKLLDELPFSHESRTVSVLIKQDKIKTQITKGSIDEMLKIISFVNVNGDVKKLTPKLKEQILNQISKFDMKGYRSLIISSKQTNKISLNNLVYQGILLFDEIIKPEIQKAIETIKKYNIDLKILTGDSLQVTKNIANNIGLENKNSILGAELNKLSSTQLAEIIDSINIFAKLSPIDKANIVNTYKNNNHVIGFLGDGVNDAVALKAADVGISVNNGVPLAKAAADVILLEKDLDALENSFIQGRKIFTNAIKYIKLTVACNFGLMLTLLISTLALNFSAMSPLQLLLQNLIYDFLNLVFVFDKVDQDSIKKPMSWNTKTIIPFALWNGFVATLISITNFLIVGFGMGLFNEINSGNDLAIKQFQTMFFLESLISHMVLIIVYRTEKISIINSRPSWQLITGMMFFIGISMILTYVNPIANTISFKSPDKIWYLYLFGLLILGWFLGEISKLLYKKTFHTWF